MAILPIDIQTIIAQMNRAGQMQHNVEQNPIIQQHNYGNVIRNESQVKSQEVNQVNQTENQDKKVNPDSHNQFKHNYSEKKNEKREKKEFIEDNTSDTFFKDPDKGNLIDIKK